MRETTGKDEPAEIDLIVAALDALPFQEREILKLRWGLADGYVYTHEQIGKIFKLSVVEVREIEIQAMRSLGISPAAIAGRDDPHRHPRAVPTPSSS